jgi:hypothetical protein
MDWHKRRYSRLGSNNCSGEVISASVSALHLAARAASFAKKVSHHDSHWALLKPKTIW